jgi:hypothetical protein
MKNCILKSGSFVIVTMILFSCGNRALKDKSVDTIDLLNAYRSRTEVLLSQVAERVEYIALESKSGYIVDTPYIIAANDTALIIIAFRKILVFERLTGKFKYEISSYGRGPDEYLFTIGPTGYYEPDDIIFAGKNLEGLIVGYSSAGTLKKIIKCPMNLEEGYNVVAAWPYNNNYLGYPLNYSGAYPYKIEVFDSAGNVIKRYPNYNSFDKNKYSKSTRSLQPGCFFNYKDSVRFIEPLTDSIFTVSNNGLIPTYKISMGEHAPPYYLQGIYYMMDYDHLKYFWVSDFQESDRFLFFSNVTDFYCHLCFYDKKLKRTFVCENSGDKEFYKFATRPPRYYTKVRTIGLKNDIDGFLPVGTGFGVIDINKKNEMATYILASDVERWFKMNPEKAKNLPENLRKYSGIKSTDNIIVIIVKLKT